MLYWWFRRQVPAGSMEIFLQLAYGVAATRRSIGRTRGELKKGKFPHV